MTNEATENAITVGWAVALGMFLILMSGCATLSKSLEISSCAVADEKLSIGLTAPDKAVSWLKETSDQLKETAKRIADGEKPTEADEKALLDAVDVYDRIRGCIES